MNIKKGDLIDFGIYGNLYVCDPDYSNEYFWITDDEMERYNENAPGWTISKKLAVRKLDDEDEVIEECLHDDIECNEYRLTYILPNHEFYNSIIVEAPDEDTAKSLLWMKKDEADIVGVARATEEDKRKGMPILKESTPINEAEEYLVQYRIEPLSFNLSTRVKAEGERDAKKRFSAIKPDAKIISVDRAKAIDKAVPLLN